MAVDQTIRSGYVSLMLDGVQFDVKGDFTITVGGKRNESIDGGPQGHQGFKEIHGKGKFSGTLTDRGDLSLVDLQGYKGTVSTVCANGKRYVGRNMGQTEEIDLKSEEGEINVTFEGPPLAEALA